MSWGANADGRYERWRWQWLASHDSQALATFRWHGLGATLSLTAPNAPAAAAEPGSHGAARQAAVPAAVAEAASQIRALLRTPQGDCHA